MHKSSNMKDITKSSSGIKFPKKKNSKSRKFTLKVSTRTITTPGIKIKNNTSPKIISTNSKLRHSFLKTFLKSIPYRFNLVLEILPL